jgi:hypothetical protein
MSESTINPSLLSYLGGLDIISEQQALTWRPDDPVYRADMYRQAMMNLSWSYFAHFHADAEHPDWGPVFNPVYTDQPNPDDIYLYTPIRGDLTYRVSGLRGTAFLLTFNTLKGFAGLVDELVAGDYTNDFDDTELEVGPDGELEIIFSTQRPAGYSGNWAKIHPEADTMLVRYRMVDWEKERDPQLSIECLDPVPPKPRLTPNQILHKITEMSKLPMRYNKDFYPFQNNVKEEAGINRFVNRSYLGGLSKQVYWPAVFELDDGEALIIETEMPKKRYYWNIQMNDPYYNATEIVYRFSSINEATAHISSDGKLRAIVALEDPGVPNWLDPAGFKEGTIYGRWYDCDSNPMPTIKRVKLAELADHLPSDTPVVTAEERADLLRRRVRAAQRRRRW